MNSVTQHFGWITWMNKIFNLAVNSLYKGYIISYGIWNYLSSHPDKELFPLLISMCDVCI